MKRRTKRFWAMFLALMMLCTCMPANITEAKAASASKKVAVKSVSLNKTQFVLAKGQKLSLKATILPKLAAKSNKVKWTSSNSKLVKVSSKGVAQAVGKKGKVVITARAGSKKATCKITIGAAVKKITASNITLEVGKSKTIKPKLTPSKPVISKLTYKSSNTKVATVSSSGKVTAKKAGSANITITATDRGTVKKVIKVTVKKAKPEETTTEEKPPVEVPPTFSISLNESEKELSIGEAYKINATFTGSTEEVDDKTLYYESSDNTVVAINSVNGDVKAVGTGEAAVTVISAKDSRVKATCTIKVSEEGISKKEVSSQSGLEEALKLNEKGILTLKTDEKNIIIPEGDYSNITLVVEAPNAHIENKGKFNNVLVKSIAKDTWVEQCGNDLYVYGSGHYQFDAQGKPNVFVQEATDAVTVTNDGDLQGIFIAQAAKVLVKGDSVAGRVNLVNQYGKDIETYVPLDIYSVDKYQLTVGPGGEQTAIKVNNSENIPDVKGIGTLTVTIDSTGENQTVIAENDDTMELPASAIQGKILNEDSTSASNVKVYLVKYSKKVDGDNISVYLSGTDTKTTKTDENGQYIFSDTKVGNYIIVVEAEGYQLITVNTYVPVSYADKVYEQDDIVLLKDAGQAGTIKGVLTDAENGDKIGIGLSVILRKGMNNITKDTVAETVSDSNGEYTFENVVPGQYTIQVVDRRDNGDYVSAYYNISLMSSETRTKNIVVSRNVGNTSTRFVLSWEGEGEGVSPDLDIHLCGMDISDCDDFDVRFGNTYEYVKDIFTDTSGNIGLDVDDKSYEGPETITLSNVTDGYYNLFVQDYTNMGYGNSLKTSKPVIKVYSGNILTDTIKMPEKDGGNWFVGVYDVKSKKINIVNDVYEGTVNSTVRAQITKYLNYFEQFVVEDAQAFAGYQSIIDLAKDNYTKESDVTKLQKYLDDLTNAYEEVKTQMTIDKIKDVEITVYEPYGYREDHNYMYLQGSNIEPSLSIESSVEGLEAAFALKEYDYTDSRYRYYDVKLSNTKLGIYTKYYMSHEATEDEWVKEIYDEGNENWYFDNYRISANAYGKNPKIGRNLTYKLCDGVKINSAEYREDVAEDKWSYDDYTLVLHLENENTGRKIDYKIKYKVSGAVLRNIVDDNNIYYSIYNNRYNYDWTDSASVRIYGENEELGNTWRPVIDSNCTYELLDPSKEEDGYYDGVDAVLKVSEDNGAVCTYYIYYYMDTSDAELLGITDNTNVFTYYDESNGYYSDSSVYNIYLKGVKSELGENLKLHVREGATAEIEYATGSVSFENSSSDAKITITGKSGRKRIYYLIYTKTADNILAKNISSETGNINKIYVDASYSNYIYITGFDKKLPEDLKIEPVEGYSVEIKAGSEEESKQAVFTKNDTGEQVVYNIRYTREQLTKDIVNIVSEKDSKLVTDIYSYDNTMDIDGEIIYYRRCKITGDSPSMPDDIVITTSRGTTSEVIYAKDNADWKYGDEYQAAVKVKDELGEEQLYLVTYKMDMSGTKVKEIKDDNNKYIEIETYEGEHIYKKDDIEKDASIIYIVGENSNIGDSYEIRVPAGSQIINRVKKGSEEWDIDDSAYLESSMGYYVDDKYFCAPTTPVEYFQVKAQNGAVMSYLLMYGRDVSGADVSNITLKNDKVISFKISSSIENTYDDDYSTVIKSKIIYVVGEKDVMDTEHEYVVPDGATVNVMEKYTDENWSYNADKYVSYMIGDEYYSTKGKCSEIIEVTAKNGAIVKYVIVYAADISKVKVNDVKNKGSELVSVECEAGQCYYPTKDGTTEKIDAINIVGETSFEEFEPEFTVPEGSSVKIISKSTDSSWAYKDVDYSIDYKKVIPGYYDNGKYLYVDTNACMLIEVTADTGFTKKYMVNYGIDKSGIGLYGMQYDGQWYFDDYNSNYNIPLGDDTIECGTIYVIGTPEKLPDNVTYGVLEGSSVEVIAKSSDSDWAYGDYERHIYAYTSDENYDVDANAAQLVKVTDKNKNSMYYMVYYGQYKTDK